MNIKTNKKHAVGSRNVVSSGIYRKPSSAKNAKNGKQIFLAFVSHLVMILENKDCKT